MPRVWVLAAPRAGDATQVVALAEALGWPYELKRLAFKQLSLVLAPPFTASDAGIDRLVMMLTGAESIRDVILFPLMKPQA